MKMPEIRVNRFALIDSTATIINKSYCLLVFDIMVEQDLLHYRLSAIYYMASVSHEKYVCEVA